MRTQGGTMSRIRATKSTSCGGGDGGRERPVGLPARVLPGSRRILARHARPTPVPCPLQPARIHLPTPLPKPSPPHTFSGA